MDILLKILVIICLTALLIGIIYIAICAVWFILQELNHSFKKFKRACRDTMLELEWNLNYNKRHR